MSKEAEKFLKRVKNATELAILLYERLDYDPIEMYLALRWLVRAVEKEFVRRGLSEVKALVDEMLEKQQTYIR